MLTKFYCGIKKKKETNKVESITITMEHLHAQCRHITNFTMTLY